MRVGDLAFLATAHSPAIAIAEIGVNHNGQPELAHRLIEEANMAGADVVKFQTFDAELVAATDAQTASYQKSSGAGDNQLSMLKELELPRSAWPELKSHASELGLEFLSTAFDQKSLEYLIDLGVGVLKVPSGELTNLHFLELHARSGLPVIVSTGMSTLKEVARAVDVLSSKSSQIALLHCVSAYPAPIKFANLMAIRTLLDTFHLPTGWSDHTTGTMTAIAARALGATIFERHLTLDHSMPGPDHKASSTPAEFSEYVNAIRICEAALGTGEKVPQECELEIRQVARRSLYARHNIKRGEKLTQENTVALRPLTGIPASEDLSGRVAKSDLVAMSPICWSDVE